MNIKDKLISISSTSGNKAKIALLESYKATDSDGMLSKVIYSALSKRIKFYIKQIPEYTQEQVTLDLKTAIDMLSKLSSREITGTKAVNYLKDILSHLSKDDAFVIERIIEKNLKINLGTTLINQVYTNLIEKTPYMGAKPADAKLAKEILKANGKAFSQTKMDGRYNNSIITNGFVENESRQGETAYLNGAMFIAELEQISKDVVLNGELTMDNYTRYEANGIIASLISIGEKYMNGYDVSKELIDFEKDKKIDYQSALDLIHFTVWDMISYDEYLNKKSKTPYFQRLENLKNLINQYNFKRVSIVDTKVVTTYDEAIADFVEKLNSGLEGTILKSYTGEWKDGKPNWQVKMKLEMDVDLRIVGFNYGTGKNSNVVSSLNVETQDGILKASPAGIDEKTMDYITANKANLFHKIVTCKCSGLSKDKNGNYSLLSPVFKSIRDDKYVADTLEDVINIENMIKGLK